MSVTAFCNNCKSEIPTNTIGPCPICKANAGKNIVAISNQTIGIKATSSGELTHVTYQVNKREVKEIFGDLAIDVAGGFLCFLITLPLGGLVGGLIGFGVGAFISFLMVMTIKNRIKIKIIEKTKL